MVQERSCCNYSRHPTDVLWFPGERRPQKLFEIPLQQQRLEQGSSRIPYEGTCIREHVFGNSPSSAVAIYSLRLAAQQVEQEYRTDTLHFVDRNFYVDIRLMSFPTEAKAINLPKHTQESLSKSKLHKRASNSVEVMQAFLPEDLTSGLQYLNFDM